MAVGELGWALDELALPLPLPPAWLKLDDGDEAVDPDERTERVGLVAATPVLAVAREGMLLALNELCKPAMGAAAMVLSAGELG